MELRQYQEEGYEKAIAFFSQKSNKAKPSILLAPTAYGKSVLIAFIVAKIASMFEEKVLILQPNKELLEQNVSKYELATSEKASVYSDSMKRKEIGKVTYATIQSIRDLGYTFFNEGFTKMIIDEAHLYPRSADSMIGKFLKESGITHVLGLTATPFRLQTGGSKEDPYSKYSMLTSQSKHGNFYKEIIHTCQISTMTELNFWSKLIYQKAKIGQYEVQWNSTRSDYKPESVSKQFHALNTDKRIVKALDVYSERKKVLVFVPSIEIAKQMVSVTTNSAAVWGEMDKSERQKVVTDFKEGDLRVVFNVNVLSVGFDSPNIDWIMLAREFGSLSQYYQVLGRGTRKMEGKANCLITDFGDNIERFGRIEELYYEKQGKVWKLYGESGRLLSGIRIDEIGKHFHPDRTDPNDFVMPFGVHKDKKLKDIPASYLQWLVRETKDLQIKKIVERFLCTQ